jgi:hypothetical protein
MKTQLVVDALQMALWRRKPAPGLIHTLTKEFSNFALFRGEAIKGPLLFSA